MATRDLNIKITLQDAASKGLQGVNQTLGNIGGSAASAAGSFTKLLGPIGLAIASIQTLRKVVSEAVASVELFASFDDTMRKVGAVTRATSKELEDMTNLAKELGRTTRYTATQAAEGLTLLGMAGFNANEAMQALPNVLNLAAAGGLDLGVAADIATNVLSGFGLEVEKLSRVNDILAAAFTGSNTTLGELGEGFKYIGPIAKSVGANFEDLIASMGKLGDAGIKGCYDDKTEVLTLEGWKQWSDVTSDDKFATYNEDKNTIEYQYATRLIRYHHTGEMYKVKNRGVDLCVTPDHRMFVKPRGKEKFEVLLAKDIVGKSVRYLTGGLEYEGFTPSLYRVNGFLQNRANWDKTITAKYIDPNIWAAFMGWYISEGSCNYHDHGNYVVVISQKKQCYLEEIESLLDKLPWKFRHEVGKGFVCHSEQLYREVVTLGKQLDRYIPTYLKAWGTKQLEVLYDALLKGDGDENCTYYTSSTRLKDDVQEIALKLGYATFSKVSHKAGSVSGYYADNREIKASVDGWKVTIAERNINPWWEPSNYSGVHANRLDGSRHDIFEGMVNYDGEVFCAEVPNHLLIVRRNGRAIVSGNSLAGTTLRGVIDALFNPTNDETVLMAELSRRIGGLGLVVKDTSGNFVGFTKLVEQLEKAGLKGDEALRLFGQRAGPGMAALLQVGSQALGDFKFELESVDQTTSNIAAAMEGGVGGAIRALNSAMEGLTLELGKAFSTISANTIIEIRDVFLELTKAVKDLAEAGLFDAIALGVTKMGKAFSTSVGLGVAYFKEYTNYAQVFSDLLNNNVEGATKRLGNMGAAFRGVLQDKGLLASDEEIQVSLIDKTIASYQREIETLKEKIATDREDISGWRAKLLGAKPYIEQLDRHNAQLQEILQKVWDLNRSKLVLTAKIDLKAADKELDAGIDKALAITEKIGTGTTKASGTAAVKAVQAPLDALKATTSKLRADLELQKAMLDANYRANIDSLDKYYESRRAIIEQQGQIEIDYLEKKSKLEADPTKRSDADIQAYVRQQQLVIELTKLERERYDAISKLEDDRARQIDENAAKQIEIEKTLSDIKDRVRAGEQGRGLFEAQFQEEIYQLQERQGKEIEILNQTEQGKARLQEYYRQANIERQQLDTDQYRRALTARLEMTRDITGGMADTFADLYELTGEKQKEFFYLAKAAALAEVGVNTALGIMKAWGQGGIFGGVGAALIAVQGAVQTAKILSTGLAEGGEVPGYSPNSKSDNILARLTAGEYVQPVSSVKYYGTEFMEAIRRKAVPRSAIEGFSIGSIRVPRDYSFAEGGSVMTGQGMQSELSTRRDQINIFNYTDRNEILRALASSQGASAIINIIGSNREKVSRVLR